MHFTFILLFYSLISVSVRAGRGPTKGKNAQPGSSIPAPQPGQIIGVRPSEVKNRNFRGNGKVHPAVFVKIEDGSNTAWVVMMSNNFRTYLVPPHLRGDVSEYFLAAGHPTQDTPDGTMIACSAFTGELDLSNYTFVDKENIHIITPKPTIMSQTNFEKMNREIGSNTENKGVMLLHEARKVDTRKFEYGKLGSIEEGQIILIKPWLHDENKYSDETDPGIFVSWTGDGMLAIVLVSKELDSPKENIDAYTFKPPNKMVIKSGKPISLAGEISLEDYKFVCFKSIIFPDHKVTMEEKSYRGLRETIDRNIKKKREDPESGTGAVMGGELTPLQDMGRKRLGSPGPSSTGTTKGAPAPKKPRPDV